MIESERAVVCIEVTTILYVYQLEVFRKLRTDDGDNLVNNYRPTQPLQGRNVYVRSGSTKMVAASVAAFLAPILVLILSSA